MTFRRDAVEAIGENWEEISTINGEFENLKTKRLQSVKAEGAAALSKVVWKIATFQQSALYRMVMLGDGCSSAWNSHNPLVAILCARAMIETTALVLDFKQKLKRSCDRCDFQEIDTLTMKSVFATRSTQWQKKKAGIEATNALTAIDKLDQIIEGARSHYDGLSEFCHPNSLGTYFLFGKLDKDSRTVSFSDSECINSHTFSHIICGFLLVTLMAQLIDEIDTLLPKVLELSEANR